VAGLWKRDMVRYGIVSAYEFLPETTRMGAGALADNKKIISANKKV